jgi:hypothetical protein
LEKIIEILIKDMNMKIRLIAILMVLLLFSCKQKTQENLQQSAQPQQPAHTQQSATQPQPANTAPNAHTAVVKEIIQGASYTYLNVKEDDRVYWMATKKTQVQLEETISFADSMAMTNFTSKELQRTFDTIYFVGSISKASSSDPHAAAQPMADPHQSKAAIETQNIVIEPVEGGVSIGDIFTNRASYANKIVRVKGKVVKLNLAIMGKNWVHLQDGTGEEGTNDLLVTTNDQVTLGEVATFEGTITLDKNFGMGYVYEVLMEQAKKLQD